MPKFKCPGPSNVHYISIVNSYHMYIGSHPNYTRVISSGDMVSGAPQWGINGKLWTIDHPLKVLVVIPSCIFSYIFWGLGATLVF